MDVIEMTPYHLQFSGLNLRVSRWEGHPNEVANAIWATMLNRHLRSLPDLQGYRNSDSRQSPASSSDARERTASQP